MAKENLFNNPKALYLLVISFILVTLMFNAVLVVILLTLKPLRVTSSQFLLTTLLLNQTLRYKGNDHQPKKPLIVEQILLVRTLGNVQGVVWRICILMLGSKE